VLYNENMGVTEMCKVMLKGQWEKPLEIKCSGLTEEQAKTCELEINTLVNCPSLLNISDSDVKFMQSGRVWLKGVERKVWHKLQTQSKYR
jgi:hypothetical protein